MRLLVARWRLLSTKHRTLVLGVALAAMLSVALGLALRRDNRVLLFAMPLRPEQVSEVVERLAGWNVAFVAGSDNVRVDANRRNDLLMRLSLAGVPHAHLASSNEVLEKAGPLTPQSILDAQQRDGLAGDIARGLRGFAGIDDAQVIVAPAIAGAFVDEPSHQASASVRLTMRLGAPLGPQMLDAVRAFVAAGVPGLDPKRVAVLDDRGLVSGGAAGDGEESSLQTSLQSALDAAFGIGAAIVRVRVWRDPRSREIRETIDKPLGSRSLHSATADEHYKSAQKTYTKRHASEDRGSDVRQESVEVPEGRLERISVAVLVDRARHLEVDKIASLASATVGLAPERGDAVSVQEVTFAKDAPRSAPPFASIVGLLDDVAPVAIGAFALLCALRWGAEPLAGLVDRIAQRVSLRRARKSLTGVAPAQVLGALSGEPAHTAAAIISALPAATATAVLEMYPSEERAAIVRRMARAAAPVIPDCEAFLRRA
jgi:flagellar biosynthesis/type III secretory pathway M-ring protein FliF/YscJ